MKFSIQDYETIIFDCDGVILNSNNIKTKAFYETVLPYGKKFAETLVQYHIQNGGISRYQKFEFFLKEIVKLEVTEENLNKLLDSFSEITKLALLRCQIADGIFELREQLKSDWIVVSGGDQDELNEVFSSRNISPLFVKSCIFGSPESKDVILDREIRLSTIKNPALYIGDSQYDHEVSRNFSLDFIFLSNWTEFLNWREYTNLNSITTYGSIKDLLLSKT
jgi:phosphoglycolate phosphatase-like HAD superfamily hydrolase